MGCQYLRNLWKRNILFTVPFCGHHCINTSLSPHRHPQCQSTFLTMDTATKPYYVTGRNDTGVVAPRLSIEELQLKDEQFTLFILSFLIIQDRKDSLMSGPLPIPPGTGVAAATFFNIAAIHGKPYGRWPGDHKEYRSDFDANDPKDTEPVPSRFGGMLPSLAHA